MLTGALAPTDGYVNVAGKDIRTDLKAIRQDIGICLQHDCLFPNLTVREHVQFFSRLKGLYKKVSKEEAEEQIDQSIRDVALFEKRNTFSKDLSGGMKRKLSVAVAFIESKFVVLDEPTSGMDPFSRRFIWNVIRNYKKDRIIILTTHFMDEADILGDRIAIMAEGQLRCAGSSLFLKKNYGVGYQLTVEKSRQDKLVMRGPKNTADDVNDSDDSAAPNDGELEAASVNLSRLIKASVPQATLLNDVGTEVRYQLPLGASDKFATMFESLDAEVDQGSIVSYGVSMTTLGKNQTLLSVVFDRCSPLL
jgi:ATP-binding cassette, subfamily A (ABC1), member 3